MAPGPAGLRRSIVAATALLLLVGCGHATLPPVASVQPTLPEGLSPLRDLSHDECPDLSEPGLKLFRSGGLDRRVHFLYPEGATAMAEGAAAYPLLVVFHGLGATGKSMIPRLDLEALAARGVVVAVPDSHPSARLSWGAGPGGMADAVLLEDIRHCAWRDLGADLARLHATGFSAGGLWTTLLTMYASEVLAGATIYSGGVLKPWVLYKRPKLPVPVLILWGGEDDHYRSRGFNVRFDGGTRTFSEGLAGDGHRVVRCNHGQGHHLPAEFSPLLHEWTLAHRFGAAAEMPEWDAALPPECEVLAVPGL